MNDAIYILDVYYNFKYDEYYKVKSFNGKTTEIIFDVFIDKCCREWIGTSKMKISKFRESSENFKLIKRDKIFE